MLPRTDLPEVQELPTAFGWLMWDQAAEEVERLAAQRSPEAWSIEPAGTTQSNRAAFRRAALLG